MATVAEMTKRCPRCEIEKPLSAFPRDRSRRDGKYPYCSACSADRMRNRYAADPAAARERQRPVSRDYHRRVKEETLSVYGGTCACCGEGKVEFLSLDHVNGGGTKQRRELGISGVKFYYWLKKRGWPEGYRVLCHNCNQALGAYGFCPHEREVREVISLAV